MQWTSDPIYGSAWWVVAAGVLILLFLHLVVPLAADLTVRQRRILWSLRGGLLVLLLLAMLRPALVRTDNQPAPATLAILMDQSLSMTFPAGDGRDRWSGQKEVWQRLQPIWGQPDESLDVQVWMYDKEADRISVESVDQRFQQSPDGRETDLAAPLRAAISGASGRPLAGVVLMGDGTQTSRSDGPGPQQLARTLSSLDVPLWTVPIGLRGGDDSQRDVEVDQLPESLRVFSGNQFSLSAVVRTQSLVGAQIPVRVRLIPSSDQQEETELAVRSVVPRVQSDSQAVEFSLTAPQAGRYRLEVSADEQPGEALTINNQQIAFLDVREGGGRILYVEGEPRQEQLRIRQSLGRFPDLEIDYLWVRRDTADRWPVDLDLVLAPNRFDIFIVGDLHSDAFGTEQLQQLQQRIGQGAGLLMLGGLNTFDVGGYAGSPIAEVLPITLRSDLARSLVSSPPAESRVTEPVPLRVVKPHPILQLDPSRPPQQVFDQLRPLLECNRFTDVKAVPGIQVLLESDRQDPLLVVGEYGQGRVVTFAGDSTWQWWRQGNSTLHRRFWRQMMLWLLARDTVAEDSITVEIDARRFAPDTRPGFRLRLRSSDDSQPPPKLAAEVVSDAGEVIALPFSEQASQAGEFIVGGELPELPAGLYRLRGFVAEDGDSGAAVPDELEFQVVEMDRERMRPLADPGYMEQLAALTADAGGRAFAPDQADQLAETIENQRRAAIAPIVERYRLGDDPASGWILMLLFTLLLGTQWALQRLWGLP